MVYKRKVLNFLIIMNYKTIISRKIIDIINPLFLPIYSCFADRLILNFGNEKKALTAQTGIYYRNPKKRHNTIVPNTSKTLIFSIQKTQP